MRTLRSAWVMALVVAVFSGTVRAEEPLPPAAYRLKEDQASTGTNIRSTVVYGSAIPLNRRYAEMTAEERRLVKSQYEPMADDDEPPFPVNGLGPVYADVQKVVQKLQVAGQMTFAVDINADGEATAVKVLLAADPKLTRTVASVLMLTKYKPAICAGRPCAMAYPFRIGASITR